MNTAFKRSPAFADTDLMPFGKHKGEPLQDVPARYLAWLYGELRNEGFNKPMNREEAAGIPHYIMDKIKLANYIYNAQDAIAQETGETL